MAKGSRSHVGFRRLRRRFRDSARFRLAHNGVLMSAVRVALKRSQYRDRHLGRGSAEANDHHPDQQGRHTQVAGGGRRSLHEAVSAPDQEREPEDDGGDRGQHGRAGPEGSAQRGERDSAHDSGTPATGQATEEAQTLVDANLAAAQGRALPMAVSCRPRLCENSPYVNTVERRAGAQGEIEPEWRNDLASETISRAWCGAVPEGLKFLGFSHSLDPKRAVVGGECGTAVWW